MRRIIGGLAACAVLALLALSVARADDKEKDKGKGKDKLGLDKIPAKVMAALKAKFPKAKIHKWSKEKEGKDVVYDIEFKIGDRKYEADIKEDGTIVEFEVEIPARDLPKAVSEAVEKRYPKSKIKDVMKITKIKDKKETPGGYEINLTTAKKKEVEVTLSPEGKILEDSGKDKKKEDKKEKKKDK